MPEVVGLPEQNPSTDFNASDHYGLLWWNNADGTLANVPRDTYWAWGLHKSLIVVIPSLDIVATRVGPSGWQSGWIPDYTVIKPFLEPIVFSVINTASPIAEAGGPYFGDEGSDIILNGSGSIDADNNIIAYDWDLDNDGQFDDATGQTAVFNTTVSGNYTVGLKVTDADDASDTDTATVTARVPLFKIFLPLVYK